MNKHFDELAFTDWSGDHVCFLLLSSFLLLIIKLINVIIYGLETVLYKIINYS